MKKKKSKKKGLFLIIGIILIIIIAAISYLVVEDLKQEDLLKKEIVNLSNKDLLEDDYAVEVKTTGDYAYIEEAIKTYYKELSDSIKLMTTYLNDDQLIQILSAENLQTDGPKFEKSYKLLTDTKENSTVALQKIMDLCKEETIKELIDKEKVDDYYYDLYLELMYTEEDLKELAETEKEMQTLSNNLNTFLEKVEEMLQMLETNNGSWFIENGQLYFETDALVDQYNTLYKELNTLVEENFSTPDSTNTTKNTQSNI